MPLTRERWITIGLVAVLFASTVPLVTLGSLWDTLLARTIQDMGHVPLFAWLTSLLLLLVRHWLGARVWVAGQYAGVLAVSLGLSLLTELVQLLGPRDADLVDLLRNGLGTACALAWWATYDPRLDGTRVRDRRVRPLFRAAVVIAFIASLVPLIDTVGAYRERTQRAAVLFDYTSSSQERFLRTNRTWYEFVPPPESWEAAPSSMVMSLTFSHDVGGAFVFTEPFPDWSGYEALEFDIFHPGHGRIEIGMRIDDQHRNDRPSDRFNRHVFLEPGVTRITISMDDIRHGPEDRLFDLTQMRRIVMFPVEPTGGYRIYLGPIRLVGEDR